MGGRTVRSKNEDDLSLVPLEISVSIHPLPLFPLEIWTIVASNFTLSQFRLMSVTSRIFYHIVKNEWKSLAKNIFLQTYSFFWNTRKMTDMVGCCFEMVGLDSLQYANQERIKCILSTPFPRHVQKMKKKSQNNSKTGNVNLVTKIFHHVPRSVQTVVLTLNGNPSKL